MNPTVLLTLLERESERVQKLETVCAQLLATQAIRSQGVEAKRPEPSQDQKPGPKVDQPAADAGPTMEMNKDREPETNQGLPPDPNAGRCWCPRCWPNGLPVEVPEPVSRRVELHASLSRTYRFLAQFKDPKALARLGLDPDYGDLSDTECSIALEIKNRIEQAGELIKEAMGAISAFESLQSA